MKRTLAIRTPGVPACLGKIPVDLVKNTKKTDVLKKI
jgi:hypothetical protein